MAQRFPAGGPVVIGGGGGSGSGKTTVARRIVESLGDEHVSVLYHDRYYRDRPALRLEERAALNYDHPDSLETDLLVRHVRDLREGRAIEMPGYDFARYCRRATTETIHPRRAIIVEGILIFTEARLRELFDVRIFVETDDDVRLIRRLQRDIAERGRTLDSVVNQWMQTVRPMHLEFVEPSMRYAHVIIPEGGLNEVAMEMVIARIQALREQR